jgi:hypothetical protein
MTEDIHTDSHIPLFEGQDVATTKAKIGATTLEIDDAYYSLDEVVRFVIETRVTNVNHVVNDVTGLLQRVHTLKIVEAQATPFEVDLTTDGDSED